jgi:HemY protein
VIRALIFLILIAGVMLGATWLAERPGLVTVEWENWRADTTAAVLLVAVVLVAVGSVLAYRLWRGLVGAPRRYAVYRLDNRRRRGFAALTQGMAAVAAGDADEARRQARRADQLLDNPPLTLVLSAQAAQLGHDDQGARQSYIAMLERPETEFLGLRGLLLQATAAGDRAQALSLARRALRLRPNAPWLLSTLFELETHIADWRGAAQTLARLRRVHALPAPQAKRSEASVLIELSRAAIAEENLRDGVRFAEQARRADPGHPSAAVWLAGRYAAAGKSRAAQKLIEEEWARRPHPALLAPYRQARAALDPVDWLQRVEELVARQPNHRESLMALATAAVDAQLWGEARRYLERAQASFGAAPSAAFCRLMAQFVEAHDGPEREAELRGWLARAAEAPPDPAWVCDACGAAHAHWQANCSRCGAFDRLAWRTPDHVRPVLLASADPATGRDVAASGAG